MNIIALGGLLASLKAEINLAKYISLVVQIHLAIANCVNKLCLTDSV